MVNYCTVINVDIWTLLSQIYGSCPLPGSLGLWLCWLEKLWELLVHNDCILVLWARFVMLGSVFTYRQELFVPCPWWGRLASFVVVNSAVKWALMMRSCLLASWPEGVVLNQVGHWPCKPCMAWLLAYVFNVLWLYIVTCMLMIVHCLYFQWTAVTDANRCVKQSHAVSLLLRRRVTSVPT